MVGAVSLRITATGWAERLARPAQGSSVLASSGLRFLNSLSSLCRLNCVGR